MGMTMTKVKVAEATNTQLDWLVAKCEGAEITLDTSLPDYPLLVIAGEEELVNDLYAGYSPTDDWSQMGPIIGREKINLEYDHVWEYDIEDPDDNGERWQAIYYGQYHHYGSTPLVAACRCYVKSKLGEVVEVPKELV